MGLIQQMKKQENMTERERDICNYMLEHPERVETISSRELGHATFTSAASVTRLCQKLGQKGFPEFKLQFVRELQNGQIEETQEKVAMSRAGERGDDRAESYPYTAAGNRGNKERNFLQPACTGGEIDRRGELCGFLCV